MSDTSTVTILFTDVVGSTELTQRLGDAKAQEILISTHNTIVRDTLSLHNGSEIKHTGDGIMASFSSATSALKCAIAMQEAFALHNETSEEQIKVRIGLNAGEPITEEEDLFGTAVQLAARICEQAKPGEILVSNVMRELTAGKGFMFTDRREATLKGFQHPVIIYAVVWRQGETHPNTAPMTSPAQQVTSPSIAVLPFVDMSPQKDQEYFCDGLSEELIYALTQLDGLRVIARTSAFAFKGEKVDIRDIGKKLDVRSVLEGSVRKEGKKLRVTAQLIDTAGGHHLWSEQFDRELDDVFAIQSEITLAIVDKIKIKHFGDDRQILAAYKAADLAVYNLYLKGRFFWSRQTGEGLKKAIECFKQAVEKDADYAPAYAGLARSYSELPTYGVLEPNKAFPEAKKAAAKALQIDNTLARARLSLAYIKAIYDWDWEGAEKEYQKASQLNPGYASVHLRYSQCLTYMARTDEAIKEIERALELDPLSLLINKIAGWVFNFARQYDRAIETLKKGIEMDSDFRGLHFQLGKAFLGKSLFKEAIAEFRESEKRSGGWNPHAESYIGITYAKMGNTNEAQRILNDLLRRSKEIYVSSFIVARLFFGLGEDDEGFEWLGRAFEKRDTMLATVKVHPILDAVRSDPRYLSLLKKMGLDK